ncbi:MULTISPECIES: DUF4145 domain-containing protein [Paenibacillus]|uniref:DUF4145 domain-containing protein n=1 Tax=Paenibacillus TaxID=44249 RepID=UPI00096C6FA9|nr:DUF4145 domain-containing protein [Paenibacillus odorifer]OME07563.1 hypothetical protein BSK60_30945 [Paenibacillus odorifer]
MGSSWTCPFCNRITTITEYDKKTGGIDLNLKNKYGPKKAIFLFVVCPNPDCKEYVLTASLFNGEHENGLIARKEHVNTWNLVPGSQAKVFPEYVPSVIIDDYREACLIKELSPKASATLSRRCIQGIIRDHWGIKKNRLIDEIEAIKGKVDPLTWDAIDAVRKIGNIGAHMEKDINVIIDVEPDEAALLVELIEVLIYDWYITSYERKQRFQNIVGISDSKTRQKRMNQDQ